MRMQEFPAGGIIKQIVRSTLFHSERHFFYYMRLAVVPSALV